MDGVEVWGGEEGREGGRRILSECFYFYSPTSLTVTPSSPLHYPSIPHSQSLFVATATASHVSLTTPPQPPTPTPISFPANTPQPPPTPHPLLPSSIANAVIITVSQQHGESEQEKGRRVWKEETERAARWRMEGEENGRDGGKGKGRGREVEAQRRRGSR